MFASGNFISEFERQGEELLKCLYVEGKVLDDDRTEDLFSIIFPLQIPTAILHQRNSGPGWQSSVYFIIILHVSVF